MTLVGEQVGKQKTLKFQSNNKSKLTFQNVSKSDITMLYDKNSYLRIERKGSIETNKN